MEIYTLKVILAKCKIMGYTIPMIKRTAELAAKRIFSKYPVLTITGPRQSGKTVLAKAAFPGREYVNLESPEARLLAEEDPKSFLGRFPKGAIIDEAQRVPALLSYIQVAVDEKNKNSLFVLTGSNQTNLLSSVSQSLAGRTGILKLLPFSLEELAPKYAPKSKAGLLYAGFYPRIYDKRINPTMFLSDYFETYILKDARQTANIKDLRLFTRFVKLCAGRTGQILNMAGLASDTGISHTTAKSWLSALEAGYILFFLNPYHENISKRLVKSPKIYFYDAGLASYLMGIRSMKEIENHPMTGHLYETMAVAETMKYLNNRGLKNEIFFLKDNSNLEIDLLIKGKDGLVPVEIKSGGTLNRDFFRNFAIYRKNLPFSKGILVYSGQELSETKEITITNHFNLHKTLEGIL